MSLRSWRRGGSLRYGCQVQRIAALIIAVLAVGVLGVSSASEKEKSAPRRLIFNGSNEVGEVWVNVGMTVNRFDEDYLPMVVMVANHADEPALLDRDSFRLVAKDGVRYPMPTVQELRKGYGKLGLDARSVSGAGLPWEVWLRERRLMDSNFFPNLHSTRRALVIDEITLANGYAMVDVLYFAKPIGFVAGDPFILEIRAIGWEIPIRIGMVLN